MNIQVSDFGFACSVKDKGNMLTTHCGSYAYAAPEVLGSKPYNGIYSDIWSLGVIAYAMTVGRLPFNDSDIQTLLEQIAQRVV